MKFTDYPKDLQRIVELTPEGWAEPDSDSIFVSESGKRVFYHLEKTETYEFTRTEYEQCRAQWLAEMAEENELPIEFCADAVAAMNEPVKPYVRRTDRVDWRGLCEEMSGVLDKALMGKLRFSEFEEALDLADKARKALEQTK